LHLNFWETGTFKARDELNVQRQDCDKLEAKDLTFHGLFNSVTITPEFRLLYFKTMCYNSNLETTITSVLTKSVIYRYIQDDKNAF